MWFWLFCLPPVHRHHNCEEEGEAKTPATTSNTSVGSAELREALGGADSLLQGSKQDASAALKELALCTVTQAKNEKCVANKLLFKT